jgi:ABC-type spermidine/putrescine transport system permease subunit I
VTAVLPTAAPPQVPVAGGGERRPRRATFWDALSLPAVLFVLAAFVLPMAAIFLSSLNDPSPDNYATALDSGIFRRSVVNTAKMALIVTALCLLVAYPYAYVMARSGPLLRTFLLAALMISFWTSLLVRTYAWQIVLNDTGLVNDALIGIGIIDEPIRLIRTAFAVDLGMTHILAPYLILALYAQIRAISPDLEMAAQGMGARRSVAFLRVTLPLSVPGAVAGSILVFVLAIGFYITPEILGGASQTYVGTAIIQEVQEFLRTGVGAAMAVMLFAAVMLILGLAGRFVGIKRILGIDRGEKA